MIILSKGWRLPQTGDFGNIWFPAIEGNINQLNSHNHDGSDSEKIDAVTIKATIANLLIADFTLQSPGVYRATVTVPSGQLVDDVNPSFRDPVTKNKFMLDIEKLTPTQFYAYSNTAVNCEVVF